MTVLEAWSMRCPGCGDDSHIDIVARVTVRLVANGTDADESDDGSHEWDSDSQATCTACGYCATVTYFEVEKTKAGADPDPHCPHCGVPILEGESQCPVCAAWKGEGDPI